MHSQPTRALGGTPLKKRSEHRRSKSSFRRSAGGPLFLATAVGLATASVMALGLVVAGALIGDQLASSWLTAATPIVCAMIGAATAGSVLHWRKVSSRGAVRTGVVSMALMALFAAQLVRFIDVAALAPSGEIEGLLSTSAWRAAFVIPAFSVAALADQTPGLAPIANVVGPDRVWIFLLVELVLVVGLAWWMASRALAAPLCTACRAWCVRQRGVVERAGDAAAPELVRQRIAARDWRFLRELGPARGGPSLRFDLARCPRCHRNHAVSVMWERPHWRDRCLIGDLRLGSDDMRMLLALVEGEPRPAAAY